MKLKISENFSLPIDSVTQTFAILAIRGMGKSYLSKVMAEEMLKVMMQIVIVDPIGVYWGMRSSYDGKTSGLPIVIFGGEHGDVPLEPNSGEMIANLVAIERMSVILDLSLLRKGEQKKFMLEFSETLYHKKSTHRDPIHLFLDEADTWAPQRPFKGDERLLGAIEDLIRKGRARGIGATLITQRPAILNKNVLTQIAVLVALRVVSPQDRSAMQEWVKSHGAEEKQKDFMDSISSLPVGTAWFWSPGWLDIFKKVKIRMIETFDSSATPKVGEKIKAPKKFADIDLGKIRDQMQSTIDKAKQEDPKELRRVVADLKNQLTHKQNVATDPKIYKEATKKWAKKFEEVKETILKLQHANKILLNREKRLKSRLEKIAVFAKIDDGMFAEMDGIDVAVPTFPGLGELPIEEKRTESSSDLKLGKDFRNNTSTEIKVGEGEKLPGGEKRILTVLAQHREGCGKGRLALISGYSQGGAFFNYLSSLRTKGYIEGKGEFKITEAGLLALGSYKPLPTGSELFTYWENNVGKAERAILGALRKTYPGVTKKEDLANASGYSLGGAYFNALSRLRTLGLLHGKGDLVLSDDLVDEEYRSVSH